MDQGLGKARTQILIKQLQSKGGSVEQSVHSDVTHILVGNNVRLSRVPHLLKIKSLPDRVLVLRADWLSACLVSGERTGHTQYIVQPEPSPQSSPIKTGHTPQASSKCSPAKPTTHVTVAKETNEVSQSQQETTSDQAVTKKGSGSPEPDKPSSATMTSPKVIKCLSPCSCVCVSVSVSVSVCLHDD